MEPCVEVGTAAWNKEGNAGTGQMIASARPASTTYASDRQPGISSCIPPARPSAPGAA